LRSGLSVVEFWALTPAETIATIEAANWRRDQDQRRDLALAWHIAALTRAKRLPTLKQLLGGGETRKLEGEELEMRRNEHAEMVANLNLGDLNVRRAR